MKFETKRDYLIRALLNDELLLQVLTENYPLSATFRVVPQYSTRIYNSNSEGKSVILWIC